MPVLAHVSDDGSYIMVDITGNLDLALGRWVVPDVASLIQATGITKVLIDACATAPASGL